MGFELELFILLAANIIGTSIFGKFETETPWWRLSLKWFIVLAVTYGLYRLAGHWSIAFVLFCLSAGSVYHFIWCRRHGSIR